MKSILAALLAILLALTLVACGGGGNIATPTPTLLPDGYPALQQTPVVPAEGGYPEAPPVTTQPPIGYPTP